MVVADAEPSSDCDATLVCVVIVGRMNVFDCPLSG
jgi:hypothetical protein